MTFVVFRVPDELVDRVQPAVQVGAELVALDYQKVGDGTALMCITAPGGLLDCCDSQDVDDLRRKYIPDAWLKARARQVRALAVTQRIPAAAMVRYSPDDDDDEPLEPTPVVIDDDDDAA